MAPDRPHVVVIGAGPAGLSAVLQLRERAGERIGVTLAAAGRKARHLAGTLPVMLEDRPPADFEAELDLDGVRVIGEPVDALDDGHVVVGGRRLAADAVIAAPGLALDPGPLPAWRRTSGGWDLQSAGAAADVRDAPGGDVLIAVASLPYRCPPAPYSLALELADRHRRAGRFTRITVATPEPYPLAGVGGEAPAFIMEACASAGVQVVRSFEPDLAASHEGMLRSADGRELRFRHLFLVPPHRRSPVLAGLPGDGPLVPVDERGATARERLYAVGDCAATGLPRAAGVAEAAGRTAADAVLGDLGLQRPAEPHRPSASCFLWHGGGNVSRIRVDYPEALPPDGQAVVAIDGPSPELARVAEAERKRHLQRARGNCRV